MILFLKFLLLHVTYVCVHKNNSFLLTIYYQLSIRILYFLSWISSSMANGSWKKFLHGQLSTNTTQTTIITNDKNAEKERFVDRVLLCVVLSQFSWTKKRWSVMMMIIIMPHAGGYMHFYMIIFYRRSTLSKLLTTAVLLKGENEFFRCIQTDMLCIFFRFGQ